MNHDALKLTLYFGERDRDGGRLLAETAMQAFARARAPRPPCCCAAARASASVTTCARTGC